MNERISLALGSPRLKAASAFDEVGEAVPGQDWVRDEGVGRQIHVQIIVTCSFKYFQKEVAGQIP